VGKNEIGYIIKNGVLLGNISVYLLYENDMITLKRIGNKTYAGIQLTFNKMYKTTGEIKKRTGLDLPMYIKYSDYNWHFLTSGIEVIMAELKRLELDGAQINYESPGFSKFVAELV
jgi:hypothetical protein